MVSIKRIHRKLPCVLRFFVYPESTAEGLDEAVPFVVPSPFLDLNLLTCETRGVEVFSDFILLFQLWPIVKSTIFTSHYLSLVSVSVSVSSHSPPATQINFHETVPSLTKCHSPNLPFPPLTPLHFITFTTNLRNWVGSHYFTYKMGLSPESIMHWIQ